MQSRTWNRVGWWRAQGVNAKWGKTTAGRPIMFVEACGGWHVLDKTAWRSICDSLDRGKSLPDAVWGAWALVDIFFVPMRQRDVMTAHESN